MVTRPAVVVGSLLALRAESSAPSYEHEVTGTDAARIAAAN
jgi:hypothetical protein